MKKTILFLAHDPGGYDVIKPVYSELRLEKYSKKLFCIGPAASIDLEYGYDEDSANKYINKLIEEKNILLLVTGTSWGNSFEIETIGKCNDNNIKTISILDYWSNYKNRFKKGDEYIYPKHYIVMDELAKKEAIAEGVPEIIIKVLGHPGLEKYINKNITREQNELLNNVLVLSQPLSELYGDSQGYNEKIFLEECVRVLKKLEKNYKIKFHPKETDEIKKMYLKESVCGSLEEILDDYGIVVGMTTMGLLHAYLMGKKIISYQPGLKVVDGCITNKMKLSKLATNMDSLERLIKENSKKEIVFAETNDSLFIKNSKLKIIDFILEKINEVNYE